MSRTIERPRSNANNLTSDSPTTSPQTVKNMSNLNIAVRYGDRSEIFVCSSRRELGSKISKRFGLDKSEIKMFEITKNSKKPITINDVTDKMKIEIRKNGVLPTTKTNGERQEVTAEPVKVPDIDELTRKLKDNRTLTGIERKFLVNLVEDFTSTTNGSKKRKRGLFNEDDTPVPVMVHKKVQVDTGGKMTNTVSSQTEPRKSPEADKPSTSTSKNLILESKRLAHSEKKDSHKVRKLMDDTFEDRRQYILLKSPVITLLKEKYPLLFSTQEVHNELNRIFYDNKDEEYLKNIKNSSKAILDLVDEDNPLAKTIHKAVEKATSSSQKNYARQVGALLMISNIMHQKRTWLDTEDEPCELNNYPRIEAPCTVAQLFEDVHTYKILVESVVLCEASTFPEAVLCLNACYFIFNIQYPPQSFSTFVVMEKVFLEGNDTDINDIDDQTQQIIRLIKLKSSSKS